MIELAGKIIVVTGSSIGIGAAAAKAFAKEKAKLVITYRSDKEEAEKTAQECRVLGAIDVALLRLDIADNSSITEAVKQIIEKFDHIDLLVNNAGVLVWQKKVREQSFRDVELQVRTNLEGTIKMTIASLPYIKDCVINVASQGGIMVFPGFIPYCATKFGIRGFTQGLAAEEKGLRVYSVNPGSTATKMTNYQGVPPEKVADLIVETAKGTNNIPSGGDVNVWEILGQ